MPVGTTVALLERGMKVMSAIHKRLHYAQKTEFRILARILAENLPPEYPYEVSGADRKIKASDFDDRIDVVPVSDPNIFSMAQRVTLAQTQLQLAQSNPQMHNLYAAYRRMYQALEVQNIDELLPPPPQPQPLDPAVENARALMGELVQTFPDQDHDAHIQIHLMFMKTPLVMTSPQVMGIFYSHVMEHVSQKARKMVMEEIQGLMRQAIQMAQSGSVDPREAQMRVMEVQQQMQRPEEVEKLVAQRQLEIVAQVMEQMIAQGQDPMADPLVQIRMQELALKQQSDAADMENNQAKLMLEATKLQQQAVTDAARIESQEQIADDRNMVNRERIAAQRQNMLMRPRNAPQGR
jgi:hypothetical protein